jgi:hydrogenase maturation factor
MSNQQRIPLQAQERLSPKGQVSCSWSDHDGHCLTCSDEAMPVKVLSIDQETGLAMVAVSDLTEEIDITLVEDVTRGDILLAHGGVAIARLEEGDAQRATWTLRDRSTTATSIPSSLKGAR